VTALVLDAGAFVAVDRGDRAMAARRRVAQRNGSELRSNGAVVAQVWRTRGDAGGDRIVTSDPGDIRPSSPPPAARS